MGFFSKESGRPDTLPTGPWTMVEGTNEGRILLARVHVGLGKLVGHESYPFRVGIATRVKQVADNEMPAPEENKVLQGLEELLRRALETDREAVLVLAITTGGVKEWVLYTSDPEATKRRM